MFDDNSVRALILSFIAGMSTLIGTLVVFIVKQRSEKLVSASLGFAGGVMISVSFTDLLPNANELLQRLFWRKNRDNLSTIFLLLGVVYSWRT